MDNIKNKKILIYGTGAVGGYYGGMLVKAGYDVTFIARGKNLEVLKEKGLTLIREDEKEVFPICVTETVHGLLQQKDFDYILICVKSKDTKDAALNVKSKVNANTTVVSFQNGVDNEDIIASVIGEEFVISGLVFVASKLIEPGVVYQFGYNGGMIGELYKSEKTERVFTLQKIMQEAGVDCKISDNMRGELWNKLVWNAAFNPLSVLTGKTLEKMLAEDFELIKSIMIEVRDVAIAHGISIRSDTVEFNLKRSEGFTGFKTSMLQDFEVGKPLELEQILGVVIKKAKEKNVNVPNSFRIYSELKEKLSSVVIASRMK